MEKADVALVAGLAGLFLGGGSVFYALSASKTAHTEHADAQKVQQADSESLGAMGAKLATYDEQVKALGKRVDRAATDPAKLWDAVKTLQAKVDALEQGKVATLPKESVDAGPPKDATPRKWTRGDIDKLKQALFGGEATDEQKAQLKEALASLEGEVKDAPRDIDARLALADLYVAKLLTVPDGPEKGAWSMKAVGQWTAILGIDPDNWDAHASLGVNYSFWPEQFNKRPEAIKELEAARKIQERSTPDAKHANTYLQLRLLYLKDGRTDDAKKMLDEGLRRFPDDEELKKAKEGAQ